LANCLDFPCLITVRCITDFGFCDELKHLRALHSFRLFQALGSMFLQWLAIEITGDQKSFPGRLLCPFLGFAGIAFAILSRERQMPRSN
jgi:hypothetical protein